MDGRMCQAGEVQKAVDCCVVLNQWDQAVALAQEHNMPQIQTLLFKYAAMLLDQHKTMEAVQLYRKARLLVAAPERFKLPVSTEAPLMTPDRVDLMYLVSLLAGGPVSQPVACVLFHSNLLFLHPLHWCWAVLPERAAELMMQLTGTQTASP